MMNNRRYYYYLALIAGVLFALLKIFPIFLFPTDTKNDSHPPAPGYAPTVNPGTVTLLTPDHPISPGESLSNVRFKELYWPRNQIPEGVVRDVAEVQGMYAKVALSPQVPLQRSNLTKSRSLIILSVTPGKRVVSATIDSSSIADTDELAGATADLTLRTAARGDSSSKIILRNARILGAEEVLNWRRTVLLEVDVEGALTIENARGRGELGLENLRSIQTPPG